MSGTAVEVKWSRGEQVFTDNRYSRRHLLRFDGGLEVAGSASPAIVPVPFSDPAALDPEEAFVASLSSCHMLWFLSIAAKRKFRVDSYLDRASGLMERNAKGKLFMSKVTLRPEARFSGDRLPDHAEIESMHYEAHEECFIAHSVRCEITCLPVCPDPT